MSIDTETARKVAKLARIRVAEADLPKLAGELSGILGFMEQLNEVDVSGIEPMVSVTPMRLPRRAADSPVSPPPMTTTSAVSGRSTPRQSGMAGIVACQYDRSSTAASSGMRAIAEA